MTIAKVQYRPSKAVPWAQKRHAAITADPYGFSMPSAPPRIGERSEEADKDPWAEAKSRAGKHVAEHKEELFPALVPVEPVKDIPDPNEWCRAVNHRREEEPEALPFLIVKPKQTLKQKMKTQRTQPISPPATPSTTNGAASASVDSAGDKGVDADGILRAVRKLQEEGHRPVRRPSMPIKASAPQATAVQPLSTIPPPVTKPDQITSKVEKQKQAEDLAEEKEDDETDEDDGWHALPLCDSHDAILKEEEKRIEKRIAEKEATAKKQEEDLIGDVIVEVEDGIKWTSPADMTIAERDALAMKILPSWKTKTIQKPKGPVSMRASAMKASCRDVVAIPDLDFEDSFTVRQAQRGGSNSSSGGAGSGGRRGRWGSSSSTTGSHPSHDRRSSSHSHVVQLSFDQARLQRAQAIQRAALIRDTQRQFDKAVHDEESTSDDDNEPGEPETDESDTLAEALDHVSARLDSSASAVRRSHQPAQQQQRSGRSQHVLPRRASLSSLDRLSHENRFMARVESTFRAEFAPPTAALSDEDDTPISRRELHSASESDSEEAPSTATAPSAEEPIVTAANDVIADIIIGTTAAVVNKDNKALSETLALIDFGEEDEAKSATKEEDLQEILDALQDAFPVLTAQCLHGSENEQEEKKEDMADLIGFELSSPLHRPLKEVRSSHAAMIDLFGSDEEGEADHLALEQHQSLLPPIARPLRTRSLTKDELHDFLTASLIEGENEKAGRDREDKADAALILEAPLRSTNEVETKVRYEEKKETKEEAEEEDDVVSMEGIETGLIDGPHLLDQDDDVEEWAGDEAEALRARIYQKKKALYDPFASLFESTIATQAEADSSSAAAAAATAATSKSAIQQFDLLAEVSKATKMTTTTQ